MKLLIKCLILLSVSGAVKAEYYSDNTLFGASIIRQYAEMQTLVTGSTSSLSDTGSGFALYLDKYYRQNYRINGTLGYVVYSEFDVIELMFSADYLVPVNKTFSLFMGAAVGGVVQKHTNSGASSSASGAAYGAQLGVMDFLTENVMLEMGYRYRLTDITTEVGTSPQSTITLEQFNEFYFNVLLMF